MHQRALVEVLLPVFHPHTGSSWGTVAYGGPLEELRKWGGLLQGCGSREDPEVGLMLLQPLAELCPLFSFPFPLRP